MSTNSLPKQLQALRIAARNAALLALMGLGGLSTSRADIIVDGKLDDVEWQSAQVCGDWVRTQPYVLDAPRHGSDARLVATPAGLAVGFTLDQPGRDARTKPRTPRDAADFHGDAVTFMVDFDADGRVGFEFSVALGEGIRDGLVTNQNERSSDWDGVWQYAVHETDEQWSVELVIPWSTASMRAAAGDTRDIAVFFERTVHASNERYACPGASIDRSVFLSAFRRYTIADYRTRQLDIVPYATVISDQRNDDSIFKAGADVFWKPSNNFQLVATVNPDFGQVESDELVINFSAIETVFTDKRPFFTENQGIFDLRTPANGQLIYTRRVGAATDDGLEGSSDIDAALKLNGSVGRFSYGAFAAQEEDGEDVGRLFAATRASLPYRQFRVGHLATWTDRPFLEREALVNAVDYELSTQGRWRWSGQVIRSDIEQAGARSEGYQWWLQTDFAQTPVLAHTLEVMAIDDRFDMNDLGYLERNALRRALWETRFSRANFPAGSRLQGANYRLDLEYRENTDGVRLPFYAKFTRDTQFVSGWTGYWEFSYDTTGIDDLLSRGNGPVYLESRAFVYARYVTPRSGPWQYAYAGYVFKEGMEDWAYETELTQFWYPRDGLTFNLTLYPRYSKDWLLWSQDNQFGSYEARRLDVYGRMDWLPTPGHEFRVKLQWIGIDADPQLTYRTDGDGRLLRVAEALPRFTVSNLGVQLRYRYQFGPMSDLYVVYSRGGFHFREEDERRGLSDLFSDIGDIRDADQILVKVRYRL